MGNDQEPLWEVWATRLLNVVVVTILGYFIFFFDFSGQGRLWDKVASYLPGIGTRQGPGAPAPQKVVVAAPELGKDRTLISAEPAAPALASTPAAQPSSETPPQEPVPDSPPPRLTSSLRSITTYEDGQRSSAGAAASAPLTQAQAAPAPPAASAPASDKPAADIAATARYGTARRNEMMGKAAGPVYNIKGKKQP